MNSVCQLVSKLFLSEYREAGFSSDRKHEKIAVGARVLVNTQNVVISRSFLQRTATKCTKFYYAGTEPLCCPLELLFYHVLVAVVVVVC